MSKKLNWLLISFIPVLFFSQPLTNSHLVDSLLKKQEGLLKTILTHPKKFNIQLIYTQINRDRLNHPSFIQHSYFLDSTNYFYCASLVKLPVSILALQKINQLNFPGLTANTCMYTDSVIPCHKNTNRDTSSSNGDPSLANYIKRMLLVSDNEAYGRVYEFLTPDYISKEMTKHRYGNARIVHRFDGGCTGEANLHCNRIRFLSPEKKVIYTQESSVSHVATHHPFGVVLLGKAHINQKGKNISAPKNFSSYNFLHLQQIHELLQWLIFYNEAPQEKKFVLTKTDRDFLLRYLSLLPRESKYPSYGSDYYDSYKKYFLYGDSKKPITDSTIKIFNIVGQSYGFLSDCAYIIDTKNKVEFLLSAVIYVNEDGIINDGKYEYTTIGLPYLSQLGKIFLDYERKRKRDYQPDLGEFSHFNPSSQ